MDSPDRVSRILADAERYFNDHPLSEHETAARHLVFGGLSWGDGANFQGEVLMAFEYEPCEFCDEREHPTPPPTRLRLAPEDALALGESLTAAAVATIEAETQVNNRMN